MTNSYSKEISKETFYVGVINGYKCKNINALCKELKSAFRWPENESCLDALYHLYWIEERKVKLIVEKFRVIKDSKQQELIKNELDSYLEFWNNKKLNEYNFIVEYN